VHLLFRSAAAVTKLREEKAVKKAEKDARKEIAAAARAKLAEEKAAAKAKAEAEAAAAKKAAEEEAARIAAEAAAAIKKAEEGTEESSRVLHRCALHELSFACCCVFRSCCGKEGCRRGGCEDCCRS
jgi:hypothetical protein